MASGLVCFPIFCAVVWLDWGLLHDLRKNVHQIMIKTIESNCVLLFGSQSFCIKIDICELYTHTTERFKKRETLLYCERWQSFANGWRAFLSDRLPLISTKFIDDKCNYGAFGGLVASNAAACLVNATLLFSSQTNFAHWIFLKLR